MIQLDQWGDLNITPWLLDIGERRALRAEREVPSFEGCLADTLDAEFDRSRLAAVAKSERELVYEMAWPHGKLYGEWLSRKEDEVSALPPIDQAVRWAQLQILMQRRIQNPQSEFIFAPLPYSQIEKAGSGTLDAATIFMSHRNGLPYLYGAKQVALLASSNVDQFLSISATLFELLLNTGTIGRSRPRQLSPSAQHRLILDESSKYVEDLHSRVPFGRDVASLVTAIADLCKRETWRPNVPITPGVTGISIQDSERDALVEAAWSDDGAERRLLNALASAVAHNALSLRSTNRQRDENRTVFYLNRLVCPAFGLPLGFGGYKPRRVAEILGWMNRNSNSLQLGLDMGESP